MLQERAFTTSNSEVRPLFGLLTVGYMNKLTQHIHRQDSRVEGIKEQNVETQSPNRIPGATPGPRGPEESLFYSGPLMCFVDHLVRSTRADTLRWSVFRT